MELLSLCYNYDGYVSHGLSYMYGLLVNRKMPRRTIKSHRRFARALVALLLFLLLLQQPKLFQEASIVVDVLRFF